MMGYDQDIAALRRDVDTLLSNSDITAEQILQAILTVDGPGTGLNADLLDGKEADEFGSANEILELQTNKLNAENYTAEDVLNKIKTVHGPSSGLDADLLDGHEYSEILNLINTKLNSSSYTAADILSKLLTVDGSGSGLDADTLDGTHLSTLNNNIANKVRYGSVTVANVSANTAGTVNVTISATPSLSQIICFVIGGNQGTAQISDVSGTTYTIRYKFEATGTNRQVYFVYFT